LQSIRGLEPENFIGKAVTPKGRHPMTGTNAETSVVRALKIDFGDGGRRSIYPALLCDKDDRILVDCGYPGFLPKLERSSAEAGVPFGEITGIVITHHDYDHYGALHEILEKYPHIRAMSSDFDAPFIDGTKESLRVRLMTEIWETLSDEARDTAKALKKKLDAAKPAKISLTLKDGDVMPWCGGTEVIATPGHMPGHISLCVRANKTIIAGDALVVAHGKLRVSDIKHAVDPKAAKTSAQKLLATDAGTFICYHGGVAVRNREAPQ
jgi:glyoxylase-like metal-dependent hydrolase (beta-lactamase superfamily II)